MEQLEIRLLFRDVIMANINQNTEPAELWSDWIQVESTNRDNDFIKLVKNKNYIIYHSVRDISSFETRIVSK